MGTFFRSPQYLWCPFWDNTQNGTNWKMTKHHRSCLFPSQVMSFLFSLWLRFRYHLPNLHNMFMAIQFHLFTCSSPTNDVDRNIMNILLHRTHICSISHFRLEWIACISISNMYTNYGKCKCGHMYSVTYPSCDPQCTPSCINSTQHWLHLNRESMTHYVIILSFLDVGKVSDESN